MDQFVLEQVDAARAALRRPLEVAEGLPGYYYGPEFYQVEQRSLFPRSWAAVAVGMQIPNAGDILPIELAGWPLILVRQPDGEIAAFHNICRHRALLLVSEPCSGEKSIRCPWYAWRFGLDGTLKAMPEIGGTRQGTAPGFKKRELGLKSVRVGRWLDYIFVNIDGLAPAFEDYIAPLSRLLSNYRFDELSHMYSFDDVYKGNWNIVTEPGIEDYHLPCGHPQLGAHLLRNSTPHVDYPVFGISTDTQDFVAETTKRRAWNATLIDLPRHDESVPRILFSMNVFPTGTILVTSDHLALGVHLPDGPNRTKVRVNIYTHRDAGRRRNMPMAASASANCGPAFCRRTRPLSRARWQLCSSATQPASRLASPPIGRRRFTVFRRACLRPSGDLARRVGQGG